MSVRCQELMGDDGNVFWCPNCGAVAQRTRDNPYPTVRHIKRDPVTRGKRRRS